MDAFPTYLKINAFIAPDCKGGVQHLHFYQCQSQWLQALESLEFVDEQDHTLVLPRGSKAFMVGWKNKSGEVQFCGSGAYALAWFLYNEYGIKKGQLLGRFAQLEWFAEQKKTILTLPKLEVEPVEWSSGELSLDAEVLHCHLKSGVYLLQLADRSQLLDELYIESILRRMQISFKERIHGFCAFALGSRGEHALRYFVPWHGRDEDYATGSVHQILSPLALKLGGGNEQAWLQCSPNKGLLMSSVEDSSVRIWGRCSLI